MTSCRISTSTLLAMTGPQSVGQPSTSNEFRVFQAYSAPDHELREFTGVAGMPGDPQSRHPALLAHGSGPDPLVRRIDLVPGALGNATFRYVCEGWGLIQLWPANTGGAEELQWSRANHNTERRAVAWARTTYRLGYPAAWVGPRSPEPPAGSIVPFAGWLCERLARIQCFRRPQN